MRHGTYSIVALDPTTGELGAAVQSHWFSVGSMCTWARPGVGAVATQSVVEPAHGPHALDRIAGGDDAHDALKELIEADPLGAVRQVGVVDRDGNVAVHTGPNCIPCAGDAIGAHWTCQANDPPQQLFRHLTAMETSSLFERARHAQNAALQAHAD